METPGLSHKFAMKNYLSLLCSTSLFNGLTAEELQSFNEAAVLEVDGQVVPSD